ncbi:hypothetical protein J4206_00745 [Candidatus Woesearchaeota archaeon]|nr:hypothetical protein [Candidatus Woesearchaeota archaeon]
MTLKTIKNVDEKTWYRFKNLAVRNRTSMGALLSNMVDNYDSRSKEVWNQILYGEKLLSDKESKEMHEQVAKLRKEYGFRR